MTTRFRHRARLTPLALCFAVAYATGAHAHETAQAPETKVLGHYETGIGTSDAASEGAVTSKRIETRPILRTGELLELVPGMIVTQHSGDGKANQYFLRGYNLDHGTDFAIHVDGMPVNMPTHGHGQGYADISFMIPELIERIDFRKGPYFAEEGDFSSAGAARFKYFDVLPKGLGSLTLGSFGYARGFGAKSFDLGSGHLTAALEAVGNDGPWEVEQNYRKYNGMLRYAQGDARDGFSIAAMGYGAKWNATDQVAQRAVDSGQIGLYGSLDPTDGGESSRYSLSFQGRKGMGRGQGQLDAYVISYSMDLFSNFTYFLESVNRGDLLGDQFQQSDRRTIVGANPRYTWGATLGGRETTNTIGLQFRYDDISRVGLYSTLARQFLSTTRQDKVKQSSVGVYAQNVTQWADWVRSIVGLRGDYYNFDVESSVPENSGRTDDNIVSPKVGLVFGPWAKTEYFVNAGYGFHSNDARGTVIRVDPKDPTVAVDPVNPLVRTKGAEFGIRTEIIPNLQSSLALWTLRQDSELLFVGDAGTTEASRPSKRQGVEWINYWRPKPWLLVDAELAYTKARFTDEDPVGDYIPGAIETVGQFGVTVSDLGKWYGALQARYFGPRPLIEDNSVRSDSTTIVNARVGYLLTQSLRLHLDVLNLFASKDSDISYYYPSCLRNEVGVIPQCTAPGATGVNDIHFHPVEKRQFRVSLIATF
jgi:hypothetical protein